MSLAALPTLLVVPPLNCLVAACAGAMYHRRRFGRILLATGLSGLTALSIPFVSGWLLTSLELGTTQLDALHPPAAIVILSGDVVELQQSTDSYGVGHLTLERERAGARLARSTGLPLLVSGGHVHFDGPSLASLMATSLHEDFGVTPFWLEQRSQDTWENAADTAALLRPAHIDSVYVVTHAWHMRRALIAFRAAGLHATAAPVDAERSPRLLARMLVPHMSAWQQSYYALHEWIGCAWYMLRG